MGGAAGRLGPRVFGVRGPDVAGLPLRRLPGLGAPAGSLVIRRVGRELLRLPFSRPRRPRSWLRVGGEEGG
eukprot:11187722-Lingulodinium_polyedra.AAC.1